MIPKISLLCQEKRGAPLLPPFQSFVSSSVPPFDRRERSNAELPVNVQKLDELLGTIVNSMAMEDRKEFMSSLNVLHDAVGTISNLMNHSSPTISTASTGSLGSSHVVPSLQRIEMASKPQEPLLRPNNFAHSSVLSSLRKHSPPHLPQAPPRCKISQLLSLVYSPSSYQEKSLTKSSFSPSKEIAKPSFLPNQEITKSSLLPNKAQHKSNAQAKDLHSRHHGAGVREKELRKKSVFTDGLAIQKRRKLAGVKHYADAQPSMHCHICCRSAKNVEVRACIRVQVGTCRKVLCERCLSDFPELSVPVEPEGWTCSHCRGSCPPSRAQCFTYGRSNLRRRKQSLKRQEVAKANLMPGGVAEI